MTETETTESRDHSLTAEEIFGFGAARVKAELPVEVSESELTYIPHRVFVNHLDEYHGKYISSALTEQVYKDVSPGAEPDEAEEEMEPEDMGEEMRRYPPVHKLKFQVIGTVADPRVKKIEDITEIVQFEQTEAYMDKIYKCGIVIYDITADPEQIQEALYVLQHIEKRLAEFEEAEPKAFTRCKEFRFFILISTVMTWAKTKPMDPEDPSLPFQEADFRKRRTHPNYKDHINCEKEVVKIGKRFRNKLRTLVIATSITYGREQRDLDILFKMAWLGQPAELPIFLPAKNTVPLIHVLDLTTIVCGLVVELPSKPYIIAVEQSPAKLRQIVKAISKQMGTGETKKVPKEEAFLFKEISQVTFERATLHLNMEPGYITSEMQIAWRSDLNIVENIATICNEYKEARKLQPIKIILHGPPASGKTRLAARLCEFYKLHYISVKSCINEYIRDIKAKIEKINEAERLKELAEAKEPEPDDVEEEADDEEEEESPSVDELQEKLDEVTVNMEESENGRLDIAIVMKILTQRLLSNACRNQGYVMDGFPKTLDEAKALFELGEDAEEVEGEGEDDGGMNVNKKIMPEYVITLEATDSFLCERVMNLPEHVVQGTHYTEEHHIRRLNDFRTLNGDTETVLNFFDDVEVHPFIVSVMEDSTPAMDECFAKIQQMVGKPRNFGPTKQEILEMERLAEEQRLLSEQEAERVNAENMAELKRVREAKMEKWADLMMNLQKEEGELLAVQGEPLRNYLIKFVFPTLTKGLLETARLKPADPIDYLAEFLFKENPEGKMFDPAYSEAAGEFMEAIQQLQEAIKGGINE